jgi:quercetin dioxygenase-like cupin family protein
MASHLRSSDFTKQEEATVTVSTKEEIQVGAVAIRVLVEGEHSGGSVALFEFDVPAGAKVPVAHSHDGYEETIYGLDGVLTWTIEDVSTDVAAGETLVIPRGAVHRFDNTSDADACALAIVTPGVLGSAYFREVAAALDAAAGGPPDLAAVSAIMRRHGLTPVLPRQRSSEA